MTATRHLLIAGTGRSGTSFLVRLLHECGLDTEVRRGGTWFPDAQAGLETDALAEGPFPYVIKSAWSHEYLREVLAARNIIADGLVVPIRNLNDAAASRIVVELEATYDRNLNMRAHGKTPHTQAHVPGGVVFSLEPVDQGRILAVSLHRVLETALDYSVPLLLLKFPRFATDADYAYEGLRSVVPEFVGRSEFVAAFERAADDSMIRLEAELRGELVAWEEEEAPSSEDAGVPLETLDVVAARRRVKSLVSQIKVLRSELSELTRERDAARVDPSGADQGRASAPDSQPNAKALNQPRAEDADENLLPLGGRGTDDEEEIKGDASYLDVLRVIHGELKPDRYLEIGVGRGYSLAVATCPAVGVDPQPNLQVEISDLARVVRMTSDDYFHESRDGWAASPPSLVFIDGMHHAEYALRDFMNAERIAGPSSLIVLDDVMPNHPAQAERVRRTRAWTGDVWKLAVALRELRPDLLMLSVDASPAGLLLVAGLDADSQVLWKAYNAVVQGFGETPDSPPDHVLNRDGALSGTSPLIARLASHLRAARPRGLTTAEVAETLRAFRASS